MFRPDERHVNVVASSREAEEDVVVFYSPSEEQLRDLSAHDIT